MRKRRKLNIAVWHNLASGGAKRVLYEHVKGLIARGHSVEAWCPSSADTDYLPLRDLVDEHVLPFTWVEPTASTSFSSFIYPYRRVETMLAAMERHCAACAEQITPRGFDLLFANSCIFFRVPAIGKLLSGMPKVLYLQEPYRRLYEALPSFPWLALPKLGSHPLLPKNLKRLLRDWMKIQGLRVQAREERTNAGNFDQILVNSYFSRESLLRAYGLDSEVCYLGVSSDTFHPLAVARENFVAGLGSFNFEKGIDTAIRALATIPIAKRPELIWIGNSANEGYYEDMTLLAASLDVRFVPKLRISDNETMDLLNRAALLLYTSRLEPFGLAPLEANACAAPVVAIAEGGVRETIQHMQNGILVPSRDPRALGLAVLTLLEDAVLGRRLGEGGRQKVLEQWTWEAAVDRLEDRLIDSVQRRA